MPTPFESAQLNLKLFELRREPTLRACRAWFLHEFNPVSFEDLLSLAGGAHNVEFRTVLSYWEMACSLVTTGAIAADAFLAAHNEFLATLSKVHPFLAEIRHTIGEPEFCKHMESVAMSTPDALATMQRRREKIRKAAAARAATATVERVATGTPEAPARPE